jgi:hypothetical protein
LPSAPASEPGQPPLLLLLLLLLPWLPLPPELEEVLPPSSPPLPCPESPSNSEVGLRPPRLLPSAPRRSATTASSRCSARATLTAPRHAGVAPVSPSANASSGCAVDGALVFEAVPPPPRPLLLLPLPPLGTPLLLLLLLLVEVADASMTARMSTQTARHPTRGARREAGDRNIGGIWAADRSEDRGDGG